MMYPLVGDLAADGIPVAVTCRVLGFSKQAYYAWKANPVTRRDLEDAYLINAACRGSRDRLRLRWCLPSGNDRHARPCRVTPTRSR